MVVMKTALNCIARPSGKREKVGADGISARKNTEPAT
jgi:hypothetical protein